MLVISVVMVVFLVLLQYTARMHAYRVAEAAAQQGLIVVAAYDGSAAEGRATALDYLAQLGPQTIGSTTVTSTRTGQQATVVVTGEVPALVPGLSIQVTAKATGPIERFVEEQP